MKTHDHEQGSVEWMVARLGLPTASNFDRLLTPKTRKPAAKRYSYLARLAGEWTIGQPKDWGSTDFMERGMAMEDEARKWYELHYDVDVDQVGFITRDDGLVGGSPDGLIGSDGGLEIKCPGLEQHTLYVLGLEELSHIGQVQGLLYLTGRPYWDLVSYHPNLPKIVKRVTPDTSWLDAFLPVLDDFLEKLAEAKAELAEHRVPRPWHEELPR